MHRIFYKIFVYAADETRRTMLSGSPAILGHMPFRSVTLRPLFSQSLPFSFCEMKNTKKRAYVFLFHKNKVARSVPIPVSLEQERWF